MRILGYACCINTIEGGGTAEMMYTTDSQRESYGLFLIEMGVNDTKAVGRVESSLIIYM